MITEEFTSEKQQGLYHKKSTLASHFKGMATKHTTEKWTISAPSDVGLLEVVAYRSSKAVESFETLKVIIVAYRRWSLMRGGPHNHKRELKPSRQNVLQT